MLDLVLCHAIHGGIEVIQTSDSYNLQSQKIQKCFNTFEDFDVSFFLYSESVNFHFCSPVNLPREVITHSFHTM